MTSHVHMIIGSRKDMLEDIVRDMKKHIPLEYFDTVNRLCNALYQGKLAEAEIRLLTGEITNL